MKQTEWYLTCSSREEWLEIYTEVMKAEQSSISAADERGRPFPFINEGIQFLIENNLLQSSPEDVAQFLYKGEGLNKTIIGDCLGMILISKFFRLLLSFMSSLTQLCPGLKAGSVELQTSWRCTEDRSVMEAFASQYSLCTPGVFQSTDTCYVLSFAIIVFNTSLHNHSVQDKPTAKRVITMNRGIDKGGDLLEELPRSFYESIKNEPFKIPEDDGKDWTHMFFKPDLEGCLLKLGGQGDHPILPENLSIREVEDPRKLNYFELYNPSHKMPVIKASKTEADSRVVEGNHVEYWISAPSPEGKEEWMKSIKASIGRDPFYDMLATRKRRIAIKKEVNAKTWTP